MRPSPYDEPIRLHGTLAAMSFTLVSAIFLVILLTHEEGRQTQPTTETISEELSHDRPTPSYPCGNPRTQIDRH